MPRESIAGFLDDFIRHGRQIAYVQRRGYRTERWSYHDVALCAFQAARELEARSISKRDRILLWAPNSAEWIATFFACALTGAIAVPMDDSAAPAFAQRVCTQVNARLAFCSREHANDLSAIPTIILEDLRTAVARHSAAPISADSTNSPSDPLEIIFTSGTTADPKGVVLTHANVLANLAPIEAEMQKYLKYERWVHPVRFLNLLPLSHVFGQFLGIFLPPLLAATVVFQEALGPSEVVATIRRERVSVIVAVPRMLQSLKEKILRDAEESGNSVRFRALLDSAARVHFLRRWWIFRRIHRQFGWKFWAMISGGAALDHETEEFWGRLGYAVIQGYGLTETSSLISLNHPFRLEHGSIGKALPGLEINLGEDGEILVRGENVAAGYWKDAGVATVLDADGWFHTGDLGERDANGNLYFKGRLKNVIVTPEGMNVHPEDLEAELRKEPGVRDCVVVGLNRDGNAEPCAVLLLRDPPPEGGNAAAIVERASERLAPFQQMRHWMVWPGNDLPRTSSQKPALVLIREAVEAQLGTETGMARSQAPASNVLGDILRRISPGRSASDEASKLQLTSIERVELLSALEDRYQVDLSETEFTHAETTQEIERLIGRPPARASAFHYPRWPQSRPLRLIRAAAWNLLVRPAMLLLGWPRIRGRENLRELRGPALVIANHVTYLDPAYVLEALPARFRRKLAVAMDGELLESMRHPPPGTAFFAGLANRAAYWLVVSLFNVFPLPQHSGFRRSFAFAGELVDRGWNVLVFPEGQLTRDGRIGPFRAGIGLLAARLRVPVIPLHLGGIFERKAAGKKWARAGQIKVAIGVPITFNESDSAEEIARILKKRVSELG